MYAGRTNSIVKTGGTTPTQTKEVKATSFPTVVSPDSGYALSQATVTAPDNLVAKNIKKGVSIAGVTGTYEGSGSGSNPESEFFKTLVTSNSPLKPANAPTGLITTVTLNKWPTQVFVGPDGLDLSAVDSYTLTLESLNQYYLAETNEKSAGGGIKVGNVNLIMKYSFLSGFPEGAWKLYLESFSNVKFFNDLVLTEEHVPDGIIMSGAFKSITKTKLTDVNTSESLTLTLPANITAIKGYSTVSGNGSATLNLIMQATTPPTVENSNTIQSLKTITVPAGTLEAYQTATNWSQFADKMVEATENTEAGA